LSLHALFICGIGADGAQVIERIRLIPLGTLVVRLRPE